MRTALTGDGEFVPATLKVWAAGIRPAFLKRTPTAWKATVSTNWWSARPCRPPATTTSRLRRRLPSRGSRESNRATCRHAPAAHQQASLLVKSLRARLEGKPLGEYQYRDYGSLISLSRFSAVGNLMGNLMGSVMLGKAGWRGCSTYRYTACTRWRCTVRCAPRC